MKNKDSAVLRFFSIWQTLALGPLSYEENELFEYAPRPLASAC
jgi:hypothetical protein